MLKKTILWSALASILTSAVLANNVITLENTKEFDQAINNHDLIMIKFFAPWCANSKALVPEYELAATQLKTENITLAEIDCEANSEVCNRYGLLEYPTMQIFRKGRASDVYPHERKSNGIVKFMQKHSTPGLILLENVEGLNKSKTDESILAVAYLDPSDQASLDQWRNVSETLLDDFAFAYVYDKEIAQNENIVEFPTVALYKHFDNLKDVYTGTMTIKELEDFIKLNAVPLLANIRPETFMDYIDAGRPLVYLFSDTDDMQQELHETFLPLAIKYKGKFSFAHIDATEYMSQADFLVLKPNRWPAMAIHNFKTGAKFPFDQRESLQDVEKIELFLNSVYENKLDPVIKSQSIVDQSNDDPVKIVVGNDFEKVVLDTSKDVFIEIYAPWCAHSKELEPIWQQLGEVMQENKTEENHDVIIAKMDGTRNDVPLSAGFQVKGYPTLKLFKAETNTIIDFEGKRTLHNLAKFLNQHASKQTLQIDLDNLPKPVPVPEFRDEL